MAARDAAHYPQAQGNRPPAGRYQGRIRGLSEELEAPRRVAARAAPLVIHPEGFESLDRAANSGKSSVHARLTGSTADVASYPFDSIPSRA